MIRRLPFAMDPQPDGSSCGPTCLHALYRFSGHESTVRQISREISRGTHGGTFASALATHALTFGLRATLFTCNLDLFDPSWFQLEGPVLLRRLRNRRDRMGRGRARTNALAFERFIRGGGTLRFEAPSIRRLRNVLASGHPILTGLSHTWLNQASREQDRTGEVDANGGDPVGHFVVLHGYDDTRNRFLVADPDGAHSGYRTHRWIRAEHLLSSIHLGILTHDADFFYLNPPTSRRGNQP